METARRERCDWLLNDTSPVNDDARQVVRWIRERVAFLSAGNTTRARELDGMLLYFLG